MPSDSLIERGPDDQEGLPPIFDPAGGTAPDIAGKGVANPSGAIEAYGHLVGHCGQYALGPRVIQAVHDAIGAGERTRDIGGTLNTVEFTDVIARRLEAALAPA